MILVVDAQTQKPTGAISSPFEESGYQPKDIWGPAGDGYYYASWIKKGDAWWDNQHVRYKLNAWDQPEKLGKAMPFRIIPIWPHLFISRVTIQIVLLAPCPLVD